LIQRLPEAFGFAFMTNEQVFDQIAREHDTMIKRIAMSHEARPHLAEELVQEIYVAIWRALPSFRGEASVRTFVARVATYRAVTHVMRAVKSPRAAELDEGIPAPDGDPASHAIALDRKTTLASAVRCLPLTYRQVAMLTLEGLTRQEIADALGVTANAVAIRLTRARDLLRGIMGEKP
jgi:RNA polymerase sigma-70 factor, ECF subfamily